MFKLNKKKLLILIPLTVLILGAGISLALAQSGHFKSLAKVLHISADTTPIASTYTVCGAGLAEFNGTYALKGNDANGHPYYQKDDKHVIYAGSYGSFGQLQWWLSNGGTGTDARGTIGNPIGGYTSGRLTDFPNSPPGGPPAVQWSGSSGIYGNPATVVAGFADSNTCQPINGGYIFGKVTDATSNSYLAGVKIAISPPNGGSTITTADDQYEAWLPSFPNNYWINPCPFLDPTSVGLPNTTYQVTASKAGYVSQIKSAVVNNNMVKVDFAMVPVAASPTQAILGYVYDENSNILGGIKVNVYLGDSTTLVGSTTTNSPPPLPNMGSRNYYVPIDSKYSAPYRVEFVDPSTNRVLSKYSYDSNPMIAYQPNQKLMVWDSQFKDYTDTRISPSKYYKLAYVNAVMDQKDKISLYGDVMAQEDPSIKIPTDLSLVPVDDFNNNTDISTDADGHYDFGNLNGRVTLGIEYRLTATPTSSAGGYRSSETISLVFSKGFSRQVDFKLALNPDRTIRFSGFVRRVDDQGKDLGPIVGATVSLEKGRSAGFGAPISAVNTDVNGYYNLVVSNFWDSDVPNTAAVDLSLIAYDNTSVAANNFQVEYFSINPNQGGVFRQDFNFDSNAKHLNPDPVKDVVINVQGTLKEDSITQKVIPSGSGPMSGISVTLTTLRTEDNGNTTTVVSATQITDVSGNAKFSGFPQKEAKISLGNIPEGYSYVDVNELVLTSSQKAQTIHLLKYNYDFNKLNSPEVLGKFNPQKGPWGNEPCVGFDKGSNLGNAGCCVTSLSNAIQFYNPEMAITPKMLSDLKLNCLMTAGNFSGLLGTFNTQNGGKTLTIKDIGQDKSQMAQYSGIPIIYHADGIPTGYDGKKHKGHCILILKVDKNNVYYYDPNAYGGPSHMVIPISSLPAPDLPILVIGSNNNQSIINSHKTTSFNSHEAFAATLSNQISISDNQDLTISAVAQSLTIIPFDKVYLERNTNGQKDYFLMKNTGGNNYTFTIPNGLINSSFSYKIVAINALDKKFTSVDTQVTVTKTPATFAKTVAKRYSSFAYNLNIYLSTHNVLSSLDNQVQYAIANLKSIYLQILSLFPNAKSKVGSVSGQVLISGSSLISTGPDSDVLVEIAGNVAQVDNNGNYSISNIPAGTYTVTVQGLASVKKGSIPIYSGKEVTIQAGKNVNLNILVNDIVIPFSVALSASPNPPQARQPVVLTAKVVGNYTGPLTYSYYCKIGNLIPIVVLKDTSTTNVCSYTNGMYTAKVMVKDSMGKQVQATVAITVK